MKKYQYIMEEIGRHSWAITEEALEAILRAVDVGLTDDDVSIFHAAKTDMDALAATGEQREGLNYTQIHGDTAVLAVNGPIIPRATWLSARSGLTSIDNLHADLAAVQADPMVSKIIMVYDTPGGAVTGVAELASAIRESVKPVTAYVYGMAASAGYWLASAADKVVSTPTGMVGSIGVVANVRVSKDEDSVKIISAQSPLKKMDASTKEGRETYQKITNDLAQVFINTVAVHRDISAEAVQEGYGQGAVIVAADALSRGMIDGIGTLKEVLEGKTGKIDKQSPSGDIQILGEPETVKKEKQAMPKTLKELLAEHPEIQGEIDKIKADAHKAGTEEARAGIDSALTTMQADTYPESIKALAKQVAMGEKTQAHLDGALIAFDAMTEKEKSDKALKETKKTGDTKAEGDDAIDPSGEIKSEADYQAAVAEHNRIHGNVTATEGGK